MQEFDVSTPHVGDRADKFIAKKYPEYSRSALEGLFDEGYVSVGGKTIKASHRLRHNQRVTVDETKIRQEPAEIELPILYEDEEIIVINKPEGVLTHSKGALNDEATVASFIKPKLEKSFRSGNRAGIVHRLDRATSGVMIVAKNPAALAKLQKQFSTRRVKKIYVAIAEGAVEPKKAVIDVPIERNPKKPQTFRASSTGKEARTEYIVEKLILKDGKQFSLLEFKPQTGRTHQLRVHLSYIGHSIVGDKIYGNAGAHLYLHAKSLEITLPSGERKVFSAEEPPYFKEFIDG